MENDKKLWEHNLLIRKKLPTKPYYDSLVDDEVPERYQKLLEEPPEVPEQDAGAHYRFTYKGVKLDPFRICSVYGVEDFGQQTLIKKALRLGMAHKGKRQDLIDMQCCITRMLQMMDEDLTGGTHE
jgi:hypothetical protein